MKVDSLTIRNFRNLASIDVTLPPEGVVIIGDNGQGKTNFLEAIYYLVLFRSARGARDRELVRFGEEGFFVAGRGDHRVTAGYEAAGGTKKVTVDGVRTERLGDAVGRILAVPFSPADRQIVTGGPAGRRRFLDVLLALSDQMYFRQLAGLRAALKQRNAALRARRAAAATAFDDPFIAAATEVVRTRRAWVEQWAPRFEAICRDLGEQAAPQMRYRASGWDPDDGPEGLARNLAVTLERDLRHGTTTAGPHRDDLRLLLADRDVRKYGSAGQQRTAAVALRLLEAESHHTATGATPVALYDDVFAELDGERQARLLDLIQTAPRRQAIIAAPRESEVPKELFDRPRWRMSGGRIDEG